ncbi:methylmalonyl-CoA mutase family protein [Nannocystaceae bacterium ST9]
MTDVPPNGFPAVTRAAWEARAQRELGARPLASLTRTTPEGIAVAPVYLRDDVATLRLDSLPGQPPYLRGRGAAGAGEQGRWRSTQELRHADPRQANAAALADLARGAGACWFVVDRKLRAGRAPGSTPDGLVLEPTRIADLLAGIDPSRTPIYIEAGLQAPAIIDALEHWWDEHDLPEGASGAAGGGVVYDPLAVLVGAGSLACARETALTELVDRTLGTRRGLLGISTAPYHDGGASEGEELALALASSVELIRRGEALGLEPADIAATLIWTLAIGPEPFPTIAKLRAARLVWTKLALACGLSEPGSPWIHATPSQRIWTRHAAWLNLLRGTTGCFAAAIGGADSIASAAFDGLCDRDLDDVESAGLGRGSELGRRLAINTQVILRDESALDRVIDPAGGSFYVEALTDALARAAWARFQAIERAGGLVAGLESGAIQAGIAGAAGKLRERVATRKQPITGVSSWPALVEPSPPTQTPNHYEGEPPDTATSIRGASFEVAAIPIVRLAAPFEALRDAADDWTETHAARPRIFAATIGPLAHHQARLDFARNLFAAGGIELVEPSGDDLLAAFTTCGARLAIVCGRDEDYPTRVGPLLRGLFAAGALHAWVAGRPPSEPWPDMPEVAIDHVFLGGDAIAPLTRALRLLGAFEGGR